MQSLIIRRTNERGNISKNHSNNNYIPNLKYLCQIITQNQHAYGIDCNVVTFSKLCCFRNHYAEFGIDRTILTCLIL